MGFLEGAKISVSMGGENFTDIADISTQIDFYDDPNTQVFKTIEGSFTCEFDLSPAETKRAKTIFKKMFKLPRKKKKALYGNAKDRRRILKRWGRGENVTFRDMERAGYRLKGVF